MKTITQNIYKFNELSDDAKQKAIQQYADIQVDYDWWDFILDDAKRYGLKISEFDTYRRNIDISYEDDPQDVAMAILKDWGEGTGLYNLAEYYLGSYNELAAVYNEEDDELSDTDDIIALNDEFLQRLGEEFLSMLISEYEWRTSDESIAECIEANDFEFYENGTRY